MRYFKAIFLTVTLLLFWIMPASSAMQNDASLESIAFQRSGDKGETISFALNREHLPKIFMISGNDPRLVVDFIDTRCSNGINRNMNINGKMVKGVRVGIHTGKLPKTRVVVDLVPGGVYQYAQLFDSKANILLLTIFPKGKKVQTKETLQVKEPGKVLTKKKSAAAGQVNGKSSQVAAVAQKKKPAKEQPSILSKQIGKENAKSPKKAAMPPLPEVKAPEKTQSLAKVPGAKVSSSAVPEKKVSTSNESRKSKEVISEAPKYEAAVKEKVKSGKETGEEKRTTLKPGSFLSSVSFEKTTGKGEMVIFKLNNFIPPKVFGEETGDPKVICDFLGAKLGDQVKSLIHCDGRFVKTVRIGKHTQPDKIRVVLHLVPNKNYDLQQVFFKEDNLFVIIVNSQNVLQEVKVKPSSKI